MAELSIEKKAQRYDEVVERAKTKKEKSRNLGLLEFIDENFPELNESEDEKIRKALIRFHKSTIDIDGIKGEDILAWLERQGEQKLADKASLDFKKGDILYEQKTMSILLVYERNGSWLMTFCDYWMLKEKLHIEFPYEKYGFVREMSLVPATKEQRDLLFQKMREAGYEFDFEKKRVKKIEQKPAEWSEEDEWKINRIYSILRQAADTHAFSTSCRLIGDKECIKLQDFLKSLRPHNTWKPSDEQMEAVKCAALDVSKFSSRSEQLRLENEPYYKALVSLYNDLEKLRDE